MNKQDELKHWKKESYRTLDEAERDLGMKFEQAKWDDHAEFIGGEAAAVVILSLVALSVGAYLFGA
tara:strand:- start:67 stop:264 length:198 start_codon:yes stop_codon:yes gene_type:complete